MPATFTLAIPSYASEVDEVARVKSVQFGDGYTQDADDGLNPTLLSFNLEFYSLSDSVHNSIISFFRAQKGSAYFYWTPPIPGYSSLGKYKVKSWKSKPNSYNNTTITCVFEQTFEV